MIDMIETIETMNMRIHVISLDMIEKSLNHSIVMQSRWENSSRCDEFKIYFFKL